MLQRRLSAIQWTKGVCDDKTRNGKKVETKNKRRNPDKRIIGTKWTEKNGRGKEKDAGQKKLWGNMNEKKDIKKKLWGNVNKKKDTEKNCREMWMK